MRSILAGSALAALVFTAVPVFADAPQPLVPLTPITVPGGPGHWDFMGFDPQMNRVLACHPGAKSLVVFDVKTMQVTPIATGVVNGVAIDVADNKYFTAGANQDVVVIDRATLQKTADIPTTGPCDDVVFDPKNGMVYVDHDDGTDVWVIDPKADKITGTVTVAGAPEVLVYDPATDLLYQNIKPTDQLQVIDPAKNTVIATWPTAPVTSPHGLDLDSKHGLLFTAGKNGKLAAIDVSTGKVTSSCDIALKVDEIALNQTGDRIYCACSSGFVSVVGVSGNTVTHLYDVPVATGTHTLAIDPATNNVWISYTNDTGSYLQALQIPSVATR
jgi:DNA-binding beta-propeller fold protein YncE